MARRFDEVLESVSSVVVILAAAALLWVLLGNDRYGRGSGTARVEELDAVQVVERPRCVWFLLTWRPWGHSGRARGASAGRSWP